MTQTNHSTERKILNVELDADLNVELDADLMQHVNEQAAAEGIDPTVYIVNLLDDALEQRKQNRVEIPADLRAKLESDCPPEMPFNTFCCAFLESSLDHRRLLRECLAEA